MTDHRNRINPSDLEETTMNDDPKRKLAEIEAMMRKQDEAHEAKMRELEEKAMNTDHLDTADADRLALLDRIADRVPELDLDQQEVDWTTLPDGGEALLVNGGGIDGGSGAYFANCGDDVHAVGSLAPFAPALGCIVIRPDRSRVLAHVMPDPLAQGQEPEGE